MMETMAQPTADERDGYHMPRVLTLVERQIASRLSRALEAAGSSIEEWRVLSLLMDGAGHPMTELAEFALLPPPSLTKLVDRLVSANLVHRRVDESDRRRVLAFATERGLAAHRSLAAIAKREQLSLEEAAGREEVALLHALLTRLAERLG